MMFLDLALYLGNRHGLVFFSWHFQHDEYMFRGYETRHAVVCC